MPTSDALREALRQSPDNIPLLLLFGQACLDEWNPGNARDAYERVLRITPNHSDATVGISRALFLEGKASEAAVRLEEMIRREPRFAPAHILLSQILLGEGNKSEALEHYRRAVEMDRSAMDQKLAEELGVSPSGEAPRPQTEERRAIGATGEGPSVARDFTPGAETRSFGQSPEENEADRLAPVEKPLLKFDSVGGMDALKEQIRMKILYPMQNPDLFRAYGKNIGGGVLLYGPPGCGKTMISRATAGEIGATFLCVGLHEVLDMWMGNSEKNLHALFRYARENAPSVLFFDEVDALAADRRDLRQSAGRTLINQFLAELDGGTSANDGVLVLGATNAPWHIDAAFRRPGRFDRTVFVPPPDVAARAAILRLLAKDRPMGDFDPDAIAKRTDQFSGADLKDVFDRATETALTSAMRDGRLVPIQTKLLLQAAKEVKASTRTWFENAKNYALYANVGGYYDDVLNYMGLKKS